MPRSLYVLSYDVTNDKRRRRLVKILEAAGRRVQYSVFETMLPAGDLKKLVRAAATELNFKEGDSLRIYRLCAQCAEKINVWGGEKIDWENDLIL